MSNMYGDKMRIVRNNFGWNDELSLLLFRREHQKCFSGTIQWEEKQDGMDVAPAMCIGATEGQTLMDELWECGIRPSEGSGSAGSLKATERHLADMQKLVFKGK